ncbi:MAG: GH3 auxin-responsive promoter family protein, partial [Verrucomicrobiota bacterium]|nr:GH3 auxin-responsive promoter family protein [Verrucomicrobiota bacterium]
PEALEQGQEAAVVVSTSGGLYRYRLGDRIRVDGFVGATPSIRFLGKVDKTSDLCGEKLHEAFVDSTLSDLWRDHSVAPRFAMLAPDENGSRRGYTLFVESDSLPSNLANDLETRLRQNFHYDHCLHLGQLGAVRIFQIQAGAWKSFYAGCQERGQKPGDVKPSSLDVHTGWESRFQGTTVQEAV